MTPGAENASLPAADKPSRLRVRVFLGAGLVMAFALWWLQLVQTQQRTSDALESNVAVLIRLQRLSAKIRQAAANSDRTGWQDIGAAASQLASGLGSASKGQLLAKLRDHATQLQTDPAQPPRVLAMQQAVDELVSSLRQENSRYAAELNALWRSLYGLGLASFAFALATLILLVLEDRRQQLLAGTHSRLQIALNESAVARRQAEHAHATKSRFLANLSHELRTPLQSVIGMIDLVLSGEVDLVQRQQLEVADRSARSLLLLINDILDFSRLEAHKLRFEITQFSVRSTVDEAIYGLAAAAQNKGLALRVRIDPQTPARWRGNGQRVRQVLTNLVGNAVKFTERGQVDVSVRLNQDALELAVQDTGPGIAADDMGRLFLPFTQSDDSLTRRHSGAGLGLSICRELVELMGGHIDVSSEPTKGTRFSVHLPAVGVGENPARIARDPPPPPALAFASVWLDLDADDCATCLAATLQSWGLAVRMRADGPSLGKGELHIRALRPDMPPHSLPWAAAVPLAQTDAAQRAMEAGASWLLQRPVRDDDLRALVAGQAPQLPSALAPVARSGEPTPITEPTPYPADKRPLILVVEDDAVAAAVVSAMLRKLGCGFDLVGDGQAAIGAATARPYDAVLMDCHLPIIDGYSATAQIRKLLPPRDRPLPIIALTAAAEGGLTATAEQAGMSDALGKPTTMDELAAMLTKHGVAVRRRRRTHTSTMQQP